jgi:2-hydroxymuconate-semialdehyde hydrolase
MALAERDITFEDHQVHLWEGGEGFPVLMLHGSGPGAGTVGNWRLVLEPLTARYRIMAADLVGFGASGRKPEEPYFDVPLWRRQAQALLDLLPEGDVGVIGHSLSASLALGLAIDNPRVTKVMTTGAMGARSKLTEAADVCWNFPETRDALREAVKFLVYDQSVVTEPFLDARMEILHSGDYGPYFGSMFGGDKQKFIDAAVLPTDKLAALTCDVTMLHGRDDQPFPVDENTRVLARSIPKADVFVIAQCGHSPALEHPDKLLAAAQMLFG